MPRASHLADGLANMYVRSMKRSAVPMAIAIVVVGVGGAGLVNCARKRPTHESAITIDPVTSKWTSTSASTSGIASVSALASVSVTPPPSVAPPPPPPVTFADRLRVVVDRRTKTKHPNRLDVDGDGFGDVLATGCTDRTGGVAFVYLGSAQGLVVPPVKIERPADFHDPVYGGTYDCFHQIGGSADVDGDGRSELSIHGRIFLGGSPFVPRPAPIALDADGKTPWFWFSRGGDVNGDGYSDDVNVTSDMENGNNYIEEELGSAKGELRIPDPYRNATDVVALGDVDADGFGDIALAAESDAKKVLIYRGGPKGLPSKPSIVIDSTIGFASDSFGQTVVRAGDVNGDGLGDVFIGTEMTFDYHLRLVLFYGTRGDTKFTFTKSEFTVPAQMPITTTDIDHDGFDDVVVAGSGHTLHVWRGSKSGPIDEQTITNVDAPGDWPSDLYGSSP